MQSDIKETIISCDCGDHLIEITYWEEDVEDTQNSLCFITFYTPKRRKSWGRFRLMWEALWGRANTGEEVVLDVAGVECLKHALQEASNANGRKFIRRPNHITHELSRVEDIEPIGEKE